MGADFLVNCLPLFRWTLEREAKLFSLVDDEPAAGVADVIETTGRDDLDVDSCRALIKKSIREACESDGRRDTSWLFAPTTMKVPMRVTGGMSWGDAPTDVFDAFSLAASLESVWKEMVGYAEHDLLAAPMYRPAAEQ